LKAENGKLRDEINRLKGEKGRPEFKRKDKISPGDKASQSGEKAYKRTNHKTGTTKARLVIDQTIELKEVGQYFPTLCALMSDDARNTNCAPPCMHCVGYTTGAITKN